MVLGCQNDICLYAVLLIFIGRMPFLAPTLDNAGPLFATTRTLNRKREG